MAMRMHDNGNPPKKRRVGRSVKVLSSSFSIDEEDYIVVREILSMAGVEDNAIESKIVSNVKVTANDNERRVVSLNGSLDRPYSIRSLPTSIGKLQALEVLNLSHSTFHLINLPEEIGNLHSLKVLTLVASGIEVLPASIGKLQNLRFLNLSGTRNLRNLPQAIGNLTNLQSLMLIGSGITELPASIGNLQNLKSLTLSNLPEVSNLPMEIGNLIGLAYLSLANIPLVPPSVKEKISSTLLCNKALAKTDLGTIAQWEKKLWPLVLGNAQACFGRKRMDLVEIRIGERQLVNAQVEKQDAVYLLLRLRREEFIQLLMDRKQH